MAGGSQIVINNQGITITTNGKNVFKAGQHIFKNGEKVDLVRTFLPDSRSCLEHRCFRAIDAANNEILQDIPYSILNKRTGLKVYGYTDKDGLTDTIRSPETDQLELQWFDQEHISNG